MKGSDLPLTLSSWVGGRIEVFEVRVKLNQDLTITLKNKGLADMTDVTLELKDKNDQPAPSWVRLNRSSDIGTLAVGDSRNISISFLPGNDIDQGLHVFYLTVHSSNYPATDIGLYPTVTNSGIGNVLFKVSDIYTGTFNPKNELIRGLAHAKIKLQNEITLTNYSVTTDSHGEALIEDLVVGAYKCRITANNHQEYAGRVWIKPGITVSKDLFLEYNLVTVEWEVNEITIQDKYEILLTATFETDVPAAVVVAQPMSLTLPDMEKGDVFHGEFILVNHGLIRADTLNIAIPKSDEHFQYELLTGLPDTLEAKQRITIPYRITCLNSLDQTEPAQTGGGCYSYRSCIPVTYQYSCANGQTSKGKTNHCVYKSGGCGSGGGGTSNPGGITGGGSGVISSSIHTGSGTTTSPAPKSTPMSSSEEKCLPKPEPKECENGCKATNQNTETEVGSSINTVYRQFTDEAADLFVKVPGGQISIQRKYRYNQWMWNNLSMITDGKADDLLKLTNKAYTVSEHGPDYVTKDGVPYKKTAPGIYQQDTYTIERVPDCEQYLGTPEWDACISNNADDYTKEKYRFKDKHGNWKTYDSTGRLMAYGNRHGTIAFIVYDNPDDNYPSSILDRNDDQVLWFEYDGNDALARIYDADDRQVRYEYTDANLTKVIDTVNKETVYEYDAQNNITKKINANGHATIISYNKSNDPIKVTDEKGGEYKFEYDYDKNKKEYYTLVQDPSGSVKEIWYNAKGETKRVDINGRNTQKIAQDGRTLIITDERGNKTTKEYDEWDNIKRILYPDNTQIRYEYDLKFNKIRSKQDQLDRITQYEYDDLGNLIQKTDAKGDMSERAVNYTYNDMGQVLTITTQANTNTPETVTTLTYDEKGNPASITDPENNITQFLEYDTMGNLIHKKDAGNKEWKYEYDAKGRLISMTDPLNYKTGFEYDSMDNRTAMINANLKRSEFEYDCKNNLVKSTDPLGNTTQYEYSTDNKLLKQTDPEGVSITYEYDTDRRLSKTTDGSGNTTQVIYKQGGCSSCSGGSTHPDRVIFPTFEKAYTYDKIGRKLFETEILTETTSHTTGFEYDKSGNLLKKTDRMGKQTHYNYDSLNRLQTVVDPASQYTNYAYDSRDNLVELTDANQNTTRFEYDKNNRLKKETRPLGQETAYTYDPKGNLTTKVDAKNQNTTYEYDDANRLTYIRYFAASTNTTPVKTVTFAYDNTGNLISYSDGTTSATYTYDDLNRKLAETVNFGPFEKTLGYTWYKNSLKKSFTTPDTTYQYAYNENNQLSGVILPDVGTITTSAYKWTRPKTTVLPGGGTTTRSYDPLMRTTAITAKDPGANPTMAYTYTLDAMDNIKNKTTEHGNYTYDYDDLYRLTTTDNPETPELTDETYTYDPVGNRLSSSDTTSDWSYNNNNELESHDDTSYVYDTNGNVTQKTTNGTVTSFFYNIEDRLERVEDGSGTIIATYGYDPFGRRLWKEVQGTRTYFLYSDEGLVGEYTQTGNEIKSYGWKPGGTWGTDPLFMKVGSEYYFYHNDHLGTPQKMTGVNGAVVWSAKYSVFGEAFVDPASTVENNLRSGGQYFDPELSFHYNWNRYYDPIAGRYLRPDENGLSANVNVYNYANNNPNLYIDPNGEAAIIVVPVIIGIGIGVTIIVQHYQNDPPAFPSKWKPKPPKDQRPRPWWDGPPKKPIPNPNPGETTETVGTPSPPPFKVPPPDMNPWERYQKCRAVCKGLCGFIKRQACYKLCFIGLIVESLDFSKMQ